MDRFTRRDFVLTEEQRDCLSDDVEGQHRYSLRRLEMYHDVYMRLHARGLIAPERSQWRRDNQYSLSMFMTTTHNVDVHTQRLENEGTLNARYEDDDELQGTDVDLRVDIPDDLDSCRYPSALNFLPPDSFREIVDQPPPDIADVTVTFPTRRDYRDLEDMVKIDMCKLFLAQPPPCTVAYESMTDLQKWAIDLVVGTDRDNSSVSASKKPRREARQTILYVTGLAGCGKTAIALHLCEQFKGRVQAAAVTGKAASLLGAPTVHGMFGWGAYEKSKPGEAPSMNPRKLSELQSFYSDTDLFIVDEVNAMSAALLAQMHETMTAVFNQKQQKKDGCLLPFGGKSVVFLGDPAQLKPVMGEPIYGGGKAGVEKAIKARGAHGKLQKMYNLTAKGQELYRKYLEPNCIMLCRGKRNSGLLQQICDRLRNGVETNDDRLLLMRQRLNFPDFIPDFTVHYDNDMCASSNWRHLWKECCQTDPPTRLYLCRASYHTTSDNHQLVDGLSALPAKDYQYASDVLCISVGCVVRLVRNINVAAGLVNSACGSVVSVMYSNSDVGLVTTGKHPPPYCIVVEFPCFQGFRAKNGERIHPFPRRPEWVPIYRERFSIKRHSLPSWIVKKQQPHLCWREQFPLDLCHAITCHRAQGSTFANCSVGVNLELDNPDRGIPHDIRSVMYVALTRATQLKDVFVSNISEQSWEKIGKSSTMSEVNDRLKTKAREFAAKHGKLAEVDAELNFQPDYSQCPDEQEQLESKSLQPAAKARVNVTTTSSDFRARTSMGIHFDMALKAASSERHVSLDQGRRNFAIVAVDRTVGQLPCVVGAKLYDLQLGARFNASDVVISLRQNTELWQWMQLSENRSLPDVERVIVHVEQMSRKNTDWKKFGTELGSELQCTTTDTTSLMVLMSNPHFFRTGGIVDNLGSDIVKSLNLRTASYGIRPAVSKSDQPPRKRARTVYSDVEPSSEDDEPAAAHDETDDDPDSDLEDLTCTLSRQTRKKLSASIFRYLVNSDEAQQADMQVHVSPDVQREWQDVIQQNPKCKLDDLGDAAMHCLSGLLCSGSSYRQLVPSNVTLHNNRTVVLSVCRDHTFFAVIHCTWNTFELEDLGFELTDIRSKYFNSSQAVADIKKLVLEHLRTALTDPSGGNVYREVDVIKVVVKQLKGFMDFTSEQAGSLTISTMRAVRQICDEAAGQDSKLIHRKDKIQGTSYIRIHPAGHKFYLLYTPAKSPMLCSAA